MAIMFLHAWLINWLFSFPYQPGWPQAVEGGIDCSSPVLVDVNDDDTLEVLVAGNTRWIYLFNYRGENMQGWPKPTSDSSGPQETSSPAAGDIDNDGSTEIVYASDAGLLFAWELDGSSVPGFPVDLGDRVIRASAMLEDIDGDDTLEICVGTGVSQFMFFVYRHDGTLLFSKNVEYRIHSTAAAGDLDNDGSMEMVHGVDRNVQYGVYAWESSGEAMAGWPVPTGHHVDGSPALADIDYDSTYEIFVGSIDNRAYGWNYLGQDLPSWPNLVGSGIYEGIVSSPAVGDINNDSILEIIVGRGILQSSYGAIFAFRSVGDTLPGFPINIGTGSVTSSPILSDVDGDPDIEIVVGCQDGSLYAFNPDGAAAAGFPVQVAVSVTSSPAVGDMDLDGSLELAVGGKGSAGADDSLYIWDLLIPFIPARSPWPMFHHDPRHTGKLPLGPPAGACESGGMAPLKLGIIPAITTGKIRFSMTPEKPVSVKIFDIAGKALRSGELSLSGLPSGVYIIKFWSDDKTIDGFSKVILAR